MNIKPPIIVGFDASENTVTLQFVDEPIIDRGFVLGAEYHDPLVAQLKGALALGQENCDAAYEDLRAERDAARVENARLREALRFEQTTRGGAS